MLVPNGKIVNLAGIIQDNEENISKIYIDWGDGYIDTLSPKNSLSEVHEYNQYNEYQITIKAIDEKGLYKEITQGITLTNMDIPEILISNISLIKETKGLLQISGRNIPQEIGAIELLISYNPSLISIEEISKLNSIKDSLIIVDDSQYGKLKIGIAKIPTGTYLNENFIELVVKGKTVGVTDIKLDYIKVLNQNAKEIKDIMTSNSTVKIEEGN